MMTGRASGCAQPGPCRPQPVPRLPRDTCDAETTDTRDTTENTENTENNSTSMTASAAGTVPPGDSAVAIDVPLTPPASPIDPSSPLSFDAGSVTALDEPLQLMLVA